MILARPASTSPAEGAATAPLFNHAGAKVGSVVTSFLRGAVHTDLRHGLAIHNPSLIGEIDQHVPTQH
jgi:hypothetical protein